MNQPLLVVLPYHNGDIELARKLLTWIAELGSCKPHSILLCADASCPRDKVLELMAIARPHFANTRTMLVAVPVPSNDIGEAAQKIWPPNVMFLNAARQVQDQFKSDFLWLEPDAIPIYPGWLDDISEEYMECPYRFMGSLIKQQGQEGLPPEYLNGVAVYPNDAFQVFDKIASVKDSTQAFDVGSAAAVVPKSLNTRLIQHYYGTKELPPVFVESRAPDAPKNHVTLDFIPKEAAIFHRSKDGKLIDLLMARRTEVAKKEPETIEAGRLLEPGPEPEKTPAAPEKTSPQPPEASNTNQPLPPKPRGTQRASA
jgi:hypothetical protein